MELQVQIDKKVSFETLQSQIEQVKGDTISYTLIDKDTFYALNLKYQKISAYTEFMERLHDLWRN